MYRSVHTWWWMSWKNLISLKFHFIWLIKIIWGLEVLWTVFNFRMYPQRERHKAVYPLRLQVIQGNAEGTTLLFFSNLLTSSQRVWKFKSNRVSRVLSSQQGYSGTWDIPRGEAMDSGPELNGGVLESDRMDPPLLPCVKPPQSLSAKQVDSKAHQLTRNEKHNPTWKFIISITKEYWTVMDGFDRECMQLDVQMATSKTLLWVCLLKIISETIRILRPLT